MKHNRILKNVTSCVIALCVIAGSIFFIKKSPHIAPGITYTHIKKKKPERLSIHILEVDPQKATIELVVTTKDNKQIQPLSKIATQQNALAAVNGGFFHYERDNLSDSYPVGLVKINNQWISKKFRKKGRGTIGWNKKTQKPQITRMTLAPKTHRFIINDKKPSKKEQELWNAMDYILEGAPALIVHNKIIENVNQLENVGENFVENRHPRTAVGVKEDGHWIFVVVDGRQPRKSVGMTLHELASYMRQLGCTDALNLDGGGSSTMVIKNKVINNPSGDPKRGEAPQERPVATAILIFKK